MSIDIGNGKLPVDETSRQFVCNLVTSKGELIEKVLHILSNDTGEGWKEVTGENNRRPTLVSNHGFQNS